MALILEQLQHAAHEVRLGPVDLRIESGQCVCVSAPSGSGKTLLLRAIADLDLTFGSCSLGGEPRDHMPAHQWRKRVVYVPAEPGWWAATALEHFKFPDLSRFIALDLGLEAACLDRPMETLSTGERLRLALVRALELDPDVLLLDEPTGALDAETTSLVETELVKRLGKGLALLMVTHDTAQIKRLASEVYTLRDGKLEVLT